MKLFERSANGMFASASLSGHLIRGFIAAGLLGWALTHQGEIALSLLAAAGALIAMRGCPICWSIGLLETIAQKIKPVG
jgi:hypothetical protein